MEKPPTPDGPPTTLEEDIEFRQTRSEYLLEYIDALGKLATKDHLTKLDNCVVFEKNLNKSLDPLHKGAGERRKGVVEELSLIYIDIDHFKNVNDTIGHAGGDEVLRRIAELIRSSNRAGDTAARIGGEELAILMPGAPEVAAVRKAEELRAGIEALTFDAYPHLKVTASFGVVAAQESDDARKLRKKADDALYVAKNEGRNRVVTYESLPAENE